jgi:Taurine catabolism dioxygenase TauD, TfdA family
VLALYKLSDSVRGGESLLASAWTVYNELAATRPDLINTLAKDDWAFDT